MIDINDIIIQLNNANSRRTECRRLLLKYIKDNINKQPSGVITLIDSTKKKLKEGKLSLLTDRKLIEVVNYLRSKEF